MLNALAARAVGALVITGAALLGYQYVVGLRAAVTHAEAVAETAQRDLRGLQTTLTLERKNMATNRVLLEAELQREREKQPRVSEVIKNVYRERPSVPQHCGAVLEPIFDALDGVCDLRRHATAGHEGTATPATDRVCGRP